MTDEINQEKKLKPWQFQKGNKTAKGHTRPPELRMKKQEIREEVVACAHSLLKPWATLKKELEEPGRTRLEYLTGRAVSTGNTKFVQWLLEMAVGKAKNTIDFEETGKLIRELVINKLDGDKEILKQANAAEQE